MDFFYSIKYVLLMLLPIMNPLGMSTIFYNCINQFNKKTQKKISRLVAINSFIILSIILMLGHYVTDFLHINIHLINLIGGLLLIYSALNLFKNNSDVLQFPKNKIIKKMSLFPLTFPVTTGPGTITIILILGLNISHHSLNKEILEYSGSLLALFLISLIVYVIYYNAGYILCKLGKKAILFISRTSTLILLYVGIKIVYTEINIFWSNY